VDACGVELQTQAQFSHALSKEVVGSHDFRFASLQPKIKMRDEIAWSRAYAIAMQFLEEFEMQTSRATVDHEFGSAVPCDAAFLREQGPSAYVGRMLRRIEPEPFRAQIEAFAPARRGSPRSRSPKASATPTSRGASPQGARGSRSQSTPRRSPPT
jgi:hypothetical protein